MNFKPLIRTGIIDTILISIHWVGMLFYDKFLQVNENTNVDEMLNPSSNTDYAIARFQAMGGYMDLFTGVCTIAVIVISLSGIYSFVRKNNLLKRGIK